MTFSASSAVRPSNIRRLSLVPALAGATILAKAATSFRASGIVAPAGCLEPGGDVIGVEQSPRR